MRNPDQVYEIWSDTLDADQLCVTVTAWADRYRQLTGNASSASGQWRTDAAPYLRGIQDALSVDHPCHKVVVTKSNQVGGSESVLNLFGYRIHQFPCPMMLVLPRGEDTADFVSTRIDPMIASTPVVSARVGRGEDGEDAADNAVTKRFPGGSLTICASKSPATFRAKPLEVVVLDDLDACARNNPEGDIVELAAKRTNTFRDRARKLVLISTPTIEGNSPIEREYEWSSQNRFYVPCPACGEHQILEWERIYWTEETAHRPVYRCLHCAAHIEEEHKPTMLARGQWRAHRPELSGRVEGFHINALYSPWRGWDEIVDAHRQAVAELRDNHDHSKLMAWTNLDLGKGFALPDAVRLKGLEKELYDRREPRFDIRSMPVEIITAGVDVQANRLEIGPWAWGRGMERWALPHIVIKGTVEDPAMWDQMATALIDLGTRGVCVDTGAYQQAVLDQIQRLLRRFVSSRCALWGVKGEDGKGPFWPPKRVMPGDTCIVRVDAGKDQVYGSLERIKAPGPGYMHVSVDQDEKWFRQLFAERPATLQDRTRARYVLISAGRRNEVLDCAVYAGAALYGCMSLDPRLAAVMRQADGPGAGTSARAQGLQTVRVPMSVPAPRQRPRRGRDRRRSWLRG